MRPLLALLRRGSLGWGGGGDAHFKVLLITRRWTMMNTVETSMIVAIAEPNPIRLASPMMF